MCFGSSPPKTDQATKDAQAAQARVEQDRRAQLKDEQLKRSKGLLQPGGIRSLISGSGSGFGRNFF